MQSLAQNSFIELKRNQMYGLILAANFEANQVLICSLHFLRNLINDVDTQDMTMFLLGEISLQVMLVLNELTRDKSSEMVMLRMVDRMNYPGWLHFKISMKVLTNN